MESKNAKLGHAAILAVGCAVMTGCFQGGPPRIYPDKPDSHAGDRAMELYDTNKDGFLDAKELEAVPGLRAAIKKVDTNNDGKISAAEISVRIQSWADSNIGRKTLTCVVTHNGQRLIGATVKFVPEKFLGGDLKPAEGTTDAHGIARLMTAGTGQATRGVSPGFYRVEITKSGENIPLRYNTQTQLGQEVASDAAGIEIGLATYDLNY
jgi:hypothetical protein